MDKDEKAGNKEGLGYMLEALLCSDEESDEFETSPSNEIGKPASTNNPPPKKPVNPKNKKKRKPVTNKAPQKKLKKENTAELTESNANAHDCTDFGEYPLDKFLRSHVKSKYEKGAVVWAKIDGYSFWPAIVDDDPDVKLHFWVEPLMSKSDWAENLSDWKKTSSFTPTDYHVVFFDTRKRLSRAWCKSSNVKPFSVKVNISGHHYDRYKARFDDSVKQAEKATLLSLEERLKRYSFMHRLKTPGTILC